MCEPGSHFAECRETLAPPELLLQFMEFAGIGDQHHLLAIRVQASAVQRQVSVSGAATPELGIALHHLRPGFAQQGLAEKVKRGRIGIANPVFGVEDEDSAGQHSEQ